MTTIELELRKAELARMVLNESDENVIGKLLAVFTKAKKSKHNALPCRYSATELGQRLAQSEADIRAGRTLPTSEVFKPYEQWL